jgi:hypothetical protein
VGRKDDNRLVLVWDCGGRGFITFWTRHFHVPILYQYLLSPTKLKGDLFDNRQYAVNCSVRFSFLFYLFCLQRVEDQMIAKMTGQLESRKARIQNDRKARTTGKPEISENPERPY